jgi:hypothetical protein
VRQVILAQHKTLALVVGEFETARLKAEARVAMAAAADPEGHLREAQAQALTNDAGQRQERETLIVELSDRALNLVDAYTYVPLCALAYVTLSPCFYLLLACCDMPVALSLSDYLRFCCLSLSA